MHFYIIHYLVSNIFFFFSVVVGLKNNNEDYSNELKIVGDETYIIANINLKKTSSPFGNYNVSLPGIFASDGKFTYNKGSHFNGQAQLELVEANKKVCL